MEIKLENGKISIEIHDLFEYMDQEQMEEIAKDYMWHSSMYRNLAQELKSNLAAPHYNEDLFNIEKAFFTLPDESEFWKEDARKDIFYTMRTAVLEIAKENAGLRAEVYKRDNAYSVIYNYLKSIYDSDTLYKIHSMYVNKCYDHPAGYELASEMAKNLDISAITDEWIAGMIEKFNKTEHLSEESEEDGNKFQTDIL
jgi:hypothetical protein